MQTRKTGPALTLVAALAATCAIAQAPVEPAAATTSAPSAPPDAAAPAASVATLKAGTLVPLKLLEALSSETSAKGATFRLEVTDDLYVGHALVIPAGSPAFGEIIHSARSTMGGKGGELLISARYIALGDRHIRLRASLGGKGDSRDAASLWVPFLHGRAIEMPTGTELVAKVATDETFPSPPQSMGDPAQ